MKFRFEEILNAGGQLIAEGGREYTRPDFQRLHSIALRMVLEVIIGLHMMQKRNSIEQNVYRNLYEQYESLRKMIVRLKE